MWQQFVLPVKANEVSLAETPQARCFSPMQDEAGEDEGFGFGNVSVQTAERALDPWNPS